MFVLLKYFPLTEIGFFVAGINFAVAVVTYLYFSAHGAVKHKLPAFAAIALTAVALSFGYARSGDWNQLFEQRFYDRPIVVSRTTRYQHIVMTAATDPTDYRLFINGNLQFSSRDEHIYHEMLVHPALTLAEKNERVLMLGGGDGLALREVLKQSTVREVTLVDIDPEMIELARSHPTLSELNERAFEDARVEASYLDLVAPSGIDAPVYEYSGVVNDGLSAGIEEAARVSVYTVDADRLVDLLPADQDVVLIDLPDPNSVELTKLYSLEFYLKLRRLLSDGAMLAIQATSPYHAKESFLCIRRTLEAAGYTTLPYHDDVPSFGDWGWILAWEKDPESRDVAGAIARLEGFGLPADDLRYLTPERFRASLVFGKGGLKSASEEVNRLMRPVLLNFYLSESWQF